MKSSNVRVHKKLSDSGDGEQLLHGHGALRRRRPDGSDLREEEAGGEGGAALHPPDPLSGGSPAQTRRCAQVRRRPQIAQNFGIIATVFIVPN